MGQPLHSALCGGGRGRFPAATNPRNGPQGRPSEAEHLEDQTGLASAGLNRRRGARRGQWAISAGGPWRITFEFRDGHAWDAEIVDYH
jgi:proteic killer suppression protein